MDEFEHFTILEYDLDFNKWQEHLLELPLNLRMFEVKLLELL